MAQQSLRQRLEILADAAKYDASCAASGTAKKNSLGGKGVGSTERMGKHRLHQSPTAKETDTCRWWLEAERALVQPRLVLALGASAARGLLGRTVSVTRERGRAIRLDDRAELWITVRPSYLLRLNGAARAEQAALFAADLAAVRARLAELAD
jgi:uracil-DNA glycosylase